jgi:hypothetical protein
MRTPRRPRGRRLGYARGNTVAGTGTDAVLDWNAVMQATVSRVPDPFLQVRSATITQLAVFEAVNAIVGDYQPYLGSVTAPPGASPEAAAVAAAHRALASLHPDQAASLDAHRVASLAAIADGSAKDAGLAVGEAAALAILAERTDDGSNDDIPYTPGTTPGRYRPTPPFPSYLSGHAAFGAAARRVLERTLGADGHAITLASPPVPDVVLHYTSWKQITDDVDDARVYGGVHYRFDQEEAAEQGHRVGTYVLRHWLRAVHRHNAAAPPTPLRPRLAARP